MFGNKVSDTYWRFHSMNGLWIPEGILGGGDDSSSSSSSSSSRSLSDSSSSSSSSSSSWVIPEDYPYSRRICVYADVGDHWGFPDVITGIITIVFTNAYVDSRPLDVILNTVECGNGGEGSDYEVVAGAYGELVEMSSTINSVNAAWRSVDWIKDDWKDVLFDCRSSHLQLYATVHTQTETGALTATFSGNRTSTSGDGDGYINSDGGDNNNNTGWDVVRIRSYNADGTTMRTDGLWIHSNLTYNWDADTLPDYLL